MDWLLTEGTVLRDGALARGALALAGGVVADRAPAGAARFDASGLLVLPGLVDIHGDAHERQLQPRPGVDLPVGLALRRRSWSPPGSPPPISASRCPGSRGCARSPPGAR
jgi:alpha-D-ribose 1-methylphosphonate 5-triphosphate diphosphatase